MYYKHALHIAHVYGILYSCYKQTRNKTASSTVNYYSLRLCTALTPKAFPSLHYKHSTWNNCTYEEHLHDLHIRYKLYKDVNLNEQYSYSLDSKG